LEGEGEYDFTEQTMSFNVNGVTVTGQIDSYDMKHGCIDDYKTASVNKARFGDFTDWYLQGMIYAWLLRKNGFKTERCRFIALLKDHSKTDALRDRQYPQEPVYIYQFKVTQKDLFKIGVFINNKIAEYRRCVQLTDDDIPPCTPEERWDKPPKFAVMKNGIKRAVRLFDTREDADLFTETKGGNHFVEYRHGESVRCRSYCLCRKFCSYYRESVFTSVTELIDEPTAA
jgi:hypothetical protein